MGTWRAGPLKKGIACWRQRRVRGEGEMSFFSGLFKASDHPIGKSLNFGPYRVTILKLIAEGTLQLRAL